MTDEGSGAYDRGEVASSAFGRAALFAIVFGTLILAIDLNILPF